MSRVKTFDSTGVAPNGRFYAGDANAIQDHYADLSNFTQTVGVGTLQVGDSSLQLSKFGTGELQVTSAFRVASGILRAKKGVVAGPMTTTERNALPAGQRDQGTIIMNSTTNTLQVNLGSDAFPTWTDIATV